MQIDAGGTLRLDGTAGAVSNAGRLVVGDNGRSAIEGDLTQLGQGILSMAGRNIDQFTRLQVAGTANLHAGTLHVSVAPQPTLAGRVVRNVIVANRIESASGGPTVTDDSAALTFVPVINTGTLDLLAVGKNTRATDSVRAQGLSDAMQAAEVWNKVLATVPEGDWLSVTVAMAGTTTTAEMTDAVRQTLPLLNGGGDRVSLNTAFAVSRVLEARLSGGDGVPLPTLFSDQVMMASDKSDVWSRAFATLVHNRTWREGYATGDTGNSLWVKPFGSLFRQDGNQAPFGVRAKTFGLVAGADRRLSSHSRMSLAVAWARSQVDSSDQLNSSTADTFSLALTAGRRLGEHAFVRMSGNVGVNLNNGRRKIRFGGLDRVAQADYNSWSAHAGVSIGRHFDIGDRFRLTPMMRADYAMVRNDRYTEKGAGALNLTVNGNAVDELRVGGGLGARYALSDRSVLSGYLGANYGVMQDQSTVFSHFAGSPELSFRTTGLRPPRWQGYGGARMDFTTRRGIRVSIGFDVVAGDRLLNQTASLKLAVPFSF